MFDDYDNTELVQLHEHVKAARYNLFALNGVARNHRGFGETMFREDASRMDTAQSEVYAEMRVRGLIGRNA